MNIIEQYSNGSALVDFGNGYTDFMDAESVRLNFRKTTHNARPAVKAESLYTTNTNTTNEKGINPMKANLKDMFKIEKVQNGEVALTFGGVVAVRRKNGDYVNYDADAQQIVNSADLVLDGIDKMIMILPSTTIEVGDVIKSKGTYVHVTSITDKAIKGVNLETGTTTSIVQERNIFNINFFQKVTNIMNGFGQPQEEGTQQAFNPMMFLALADDKKEIDPMMLMMMMGNTGGQFNPMMLLALGGEIDPMMLMMMNGGFKF